ncbi:hypothetical protein D918_02269 [Trichuris suis]|uniref:Survival motor neuron Tudor domain-containing protein n=1 Tax=Trichuris suis TaxID=68888 RepID=A0A085MM50_9BILA|nr:hypothetical protein M513_01059 [Trichuris suis]KHJ47409.1 hypothetical protein D918_02269 [Trichuris suis]
MDVFGGEDSVSRVISSSEDVSLDGQSEKPIEAKFKKPLHPAHKYDISWDEHALVKGFTESMKLCQAEVTNPYDVESVSMSAKSKKSSGKKVPVRTTGISSGATSDGPSVELSGGRKSFPLEGSSQLPDARNELKKYPVNHQQPPIWFDEEMSSLLVSWYMAGYYSGQYAAQQEEVSKNGYPNQHK